MIYIPIVDSDFEYLNSKSTASADGESTPDGLGKYASTALVDATMQNLFADVAAAEAAAGSTKYRCFFVRNNHATLSLKVATAFLSVQAPHTTLRTELTNNGNESTVDVYDNAAFPSKGTFFVEDEEVTYTGKSGSSPVCSFAGCTRGHNSTPKTLHNVGSNIEDNQIRIAVEAPNAQPSGYVQHLDDEDDTPIGLSFTDPSTYETGISIGDLDAGEKYAIWVRRKVPKGSWAVALINPIPMVQGSTEA